MQSFFPAERKSADILHGKVVDITEHPYQVALLNTKVNKIICGGVIIKPRIVFTGRFPLNCGVKLN